MIGDCSFDAVDVGPLAAARKLEPFGAMMIGLACGRGLGAGIAVKLLRTEER